MSYHFGHTLVVLLIMVGMLAFSDTPVIAEAPPPEATITTSQAILAAGSKGTLSTEIHQLSADNNQLQIRFPKEVEIDSQQLLRTNASQLIRVQKQGTNQIQLQVKPNPTVKLQIDYLATSATNNPVQIWSNNSLVTTINLNVIRPTTASSQPSTTSSDNQPISSSVSKSSSQSVTNSQTTTSSISTLQSQSSNSASSTPTTKASSVSQSSTTQSAKATPETDYSQQSSISTSTQGKSSNNSTNQSTSTSDMTSIISRSDSSSSHLSQRPFLTKDQDSTPIISPISASARPMINNPALTSNTLANIVAKHGIGLVGQLPNINFGKVSATLKQSVGPTTITTTGSTFGVVDARSNTSNWKLQIQAKSSSKQFQQLLFWNQDLQSLALFHGIVVTDSDQQISQPIVQNGAIVGRFYPLFPNQSLKNNLRLVIPQTHQALSGRFSATLTWSIQQAP